LTNPVFIQANAKQMLCARISAYSYKRNSRSPDCFDVHIMEAENFPGLMKRGQTFLRGGYVRNWDPDDLQSFSLLRFAPPSLTKFEGRAVVTDPDCFGVGDIAELFQREMGGKPILAVRRPGHHGDPDYVASSVMVLDCAQLRHWDFDRELDDLFAHRFDYADWMDLRREERSSFGFLEPVWNSFDRLDADTRILHTTKRRTQPLKTGLPIDYTLREGSPFLFARRFLTQRYRPHPDPNQEAFVYALLAEMVDQVLVTKDELVAEMAANHIRHDSLDLIERHRGWSLVKQAA
jgi:hypothetical protein